MQPHFLRLLRKPARIVERSSAAKYCDDSLSLFALRSLQQESLLMNARVDLLVRQRHWSGSRLSQRSVNHQSFHGMVRHKVSKQDLVLVTILVRLAISIQIALQLCSTSEQLVVQEPFLVDFPAYRRDSLILHYARKALALPAQVSTETTNGSQ
eukprot:1145258-Amphidinium_carterae.3